MIEKPKETIRRLTEIDKFTPAEAIVWLEYIASNDENAMLDMLEHKTDQFYKNFLTLAKLGIQGGWHKSNTPKPNEQELFDGLVECNLSGERTVEIAYWIAADSQIGALFHQRIISFTLAQHRMNDEAFESARRNLLEKVRGALYNVFFDNKSKRKPPAN